ncbi:hypothetical protein O0L34_g2403 [Tuta absoluta]|nr:hypothetical protein O0L34_g2403 [Tuta absoluta]
MFFVVVVASESSSGVDDMTTFQTRMLQRKLAFRDLHTRARFAVKRDLEDAMDGSAGDYYGVARYTNVNVQIEDIKLRIESLNKKKDALERYARALAAADLQLNPEPGQGNRRGPVAVEPIENPQPQRARARARPSWWRRMVRRFRVAIMGQRNQRNAERH